MQIRDGPAAVRGDALRHDATGPCLRGRGREGGGGGAPSQKTCRPPTHRTPRGRRIRREAPSRLAAGGARRRDRRICRLGPRNASKFPHRIVSLSPTATETLFAIGAGKQVIAVDDQSDYPKSAPRTTLSGFTPNVEAIVGYHPDLVVISYSPKDFAGALAKAHIRVLLQPFATAFKDAYAQMLQLGRVTGHVKEATALVTPHEGADRQARPQRAEEGPVRLRRADARLLLGHPAPRSSARSSSCSA